MYSVAYLFSELLSQVVHVFLVFSSQPVQLCLLLLLNLLTSLIKVVLKLKQNLRTSKKAAILLQAQWPISQVLISSFFGSWITQHYFDMSVSLILAEVTKILSTRIKQHRADTYCPSSV